MIEWKRQVSNVVATEEGVFHDGQVPGDYSGPIIPIQVCHSITFTDEKGNLFSLTLKAVDAMNASRVVVAYPVSNLVTIEAPTNEVGTTGGNYGHRFPADVKARAQGLADAIEADGESTVL